MNGLSVLITNHALVDRAGSELYVRDVAGALLKRGHRPVVYSPLLGAVAEDLRQATVSVVDDLEALGAPPDIIHGHHNLETMSAMLRFPGTPAIFCCHGSRPWEEAPPRFPRVMRYVAVDEVCCDRMVQQHGIAPERVAVLLNFVDLARFRPRPPLPTSPRRALLLSNEDGRHAAVVRKACEQRGISLDIVGRDFGNSHTAPESLLPHYDLVFAKARSALEAMAAGSAVVLAAGVGMGPLVTSGNVERLRPLNFGIRALQHPFDVDTLLAEIDRYDPVDAAEVSRRIRNSAALDDAIERLVALYQDVIAEWKASRTVDRDDERRAVSRYLAWLSPQFKALVARQRSLERCAAAIERDRERLQQACAASEAASRAYETERLRLEEALAAGARRLREAEAERDALSASLAVARDTIHHMERSRFWKARRAWRAVVEVFR